MRLVTWALHREQSKAPVEMCTLIPLEIHGLGKVCLVAAGWVLQVLITCRGGIQHECCLVGQDNHTWGLECHGVRLSGKTLI